MKMKNLLFALVAAGATAIPVAAGATVCYTDRCNPYSEYQNPYSEYQNPYSEYQNPYSEYQNPYSDKYIPSCELTGAC
jgi:hypothetical protein